MLEYIGPTARRASCSSLYVVADGREASRCRPKRMAQRQTAGTGRIGTSKRLFVSCLVDESGGLPPGPFERCRTPQEDCCCRLRGASACSGE